MLEPAVGPEDEQELIRLIAEADRMQRLIAGYMAQVNQDLDLSPHLRRATAAYTRSGAPAF